MGRDDISILCNVNKMSNARAGKYEFAANAGNRSDPSQIRC